MFEQNGEAVKAVEGKENQSIEQNGEAVQKTKVAENHTDEEDHKAWDELPPPKSAIEKKQD